MKTTAATLYAALDQSKFGDYTRAEFDAYLVERELDPEALDPVDILAMELSSG